MIVPMEWHYYIHYTQLATSKNYKQTWYTCPLQRYKVENIINHIICSLLNNSATQNYDLISNHNPISGKILIKDTKVWREMWLMKRIISSVTRLNSCGRCITTIWSHSLKSFSSKVCVLFRTRTSKHFEV